MRLDKYLADMGVGIRSELKKGIKKGAAVVNGSVIKDAGFAVKETDEVKYNGKLIVYEKYVYYMLHKPAGVVSATEDNHDKTVLDLLKAEDKKKDIFPVGRLDKDTEGLLLLTNDGDLAHNLLSPKKHVDKTYFAKVDGEIREEHIGLFAEGFKVDNDLTALPSKLEILKTGPQSEILLTIAEGKFHQVKRMVHAVGGEVTYLKRLSMGELKLDETLKPGEYRALSAEERMELGISE